MTLVPESVFATSSKRPLINSASDYAFFNTLLIVRPKLMQAGSPKTNRRDFIRKSASGLVLGAALPGGAYASSVSSDRMIAQEGVVVFQGDSITDAGRSKDDQRANVPSSLGSGYVGLVAAQLLGENPTGGLEIHNRGISGHKVFQLAERWQEDAIDLQPDILSILIGVNDFWHTLSHDYDGTVEVYEGDYRELLDRTREALPAVRLVIGEPFIVEGGTAIDDKWEAFGAYQSAAARIAGDYDAAWVPYQDVFNEALEEAPASYWAPDGVHPSLAGNYLMAQAWLDAV